MPRRSKRLDKSQKVDVVRKYEGTSNICNVCNNWGEPADAVCDECPNAYHDKCIDEEYRNRGFTTCEEMGYDCNHESMPKFFEFGAEIDRTLKSKSKQKRVKPSKRRSARSRNSRNRSHRQSVGGRLTFEETHYKSFNYQHMEYKIGDDVVISMEKEDGFWGVARITDIFKNNTETIPKIKILWFWRAAQVNGLPFIEDCRFGERGTKEDIMEHELHLDDGYEDTLCIDVLIDNENSAKALVVGSSDEYLKEIQSDRYKSKYYDIFWCTHAYNHESCKKSLIPSGVIASHQIIGITPKPQNNKRQSRKRNRLQQIEQSLYEASKSLMLSSVPQTLLCREKEHQEIQRYMKNQISCHGQGSGLYISGMPGTGKTATVRQIARELQKLTITIKKRGGRKTAKNKLPEFAFHEINAMKLPTPKHLYTELCKKLMQKHFAPNTAVKKLEKYFATKDNKRKICVLLVDELDYLLTRQQKVIYNIFDWPTKSNAKLVVIGIANTMDLPERLLPRVASRMGTTRVVFKAYQRQQLTKIIEQRLEETMVFSNDAIRFCAMAVAGVSGDCRTALQICRRAVEIAQKEIKENGIGYLDDNDGNRNNKKRAKTKRNKGKTANDDGLRKEIVTLEHIKKAKESFDQSNDVQIVSTLSIYEKLFLTGIVMYNTRKDGFAASTVDYRQKFDNFVQTRLGENKMKNVHFRNMLDRLKEMGIITITFDKKEWVEWIKFDIPIEEAAHALKENDICAKIISTLQTM